MKYQLLLNLINKSFVWITPFNNTIQFRRVHSRNYIALEFYEDIDSCIKIEMINDFKQMINQNKKCVITLFDLLAIIETYTEDSNIRIKYTI